MLSMIEHPSGDKLLMMDVRQNGSGPLPGLLWRKSSYSNGQANCVEVASMNDDHTIVVVRDSKAPDVSNLTFAALTWRQFTCSMKSHRKSETSDRDGAYAQQPERR
jgi:hypothetical protein